MFNIGSYGSSDEATPGGISPLERKALRTMAAHMRAELAGWGIESAPIKPGDLDTVQAIIDRLSLSEHDRDLARAADLIMVRRGYNLKVQAQAWRMAKDELTIDAGADRDSPRGADLLGLLTDREKFKAALGESLNGDGTHGW